MTAAASGWSGTAALRPGVLELRGSIGVADVHEHHSVQVVVALTGELLVEDGRGVQVRAAAVVIPPDQPHALRAGTALGLLIHLEPDSVMGRRLTARVSERESAWAWSSAAAGLEEEWGSWLVEGMPREPVLSLRDQHPALAQALADLDAGVGNGPVRLAEVAAAVHVSESRLSHLFSEQLGLPFRAYVRWLRLRRAVEAVASGQSLTAAAHFAGFSDSAHLTRTWRAAFGAAPTDFGRGINWVQPDISAITLPTRTDTAWV